MNKINALFCGNPDFSVPTLSALWKSDLVNLLAVVTAPDRPAHRGQKMTSPPCAVFAKENDIPLIQTANINISKSLKLLFEEQHVDVLVVLAFSQFLNQAIIDAPKIGPFNIHTSLLPKYRGAAPIQHAIWNGDKITGVTIQRMVKKMDAGDIAYSREISIAPEDTSKVLFEKLKFECAHSINEFIPRLIKGEIVYKSQEESQASFAPILKKEDGRLAFSKKTDEQIINQIRAMDPWPGTFTRINDMRLKVLSATKKDASLKPGKTSTKEGLLLVGTARGCLRLDRVQLDGKKPCSDIDLLNGLKNKMTTFNLEEL